MANSGLQVLGFVLALLGWIANIAATIMPQWQMSSYTDGNIITSQAVYKGLWMSCVTQSTGQISCKVYDSMLQLDAFIQATRALMIVAIVVGVIAMGLAIMGMKCTNCGGDDKRKKAWIAVTGGVVFQIGGLASLIACSWYGHRIVTDFYSPLMPVNSRYEFGPAVFIGWAGALLSVLGGGLLACSCPGSSAQSSYGRQYPAGKPISKPPSSKEYV